MTPEELFERERFERALAAAEARHVAACDRLRAEIAAERAARPPMTEAERANAPAEAAHGAVVQRLVVELRGDADTRTLFERLRLALPGVPGALAASPTEAGWGRILQRVRALVEAEREPYETVSAALARLAGGERG